LWLWILIALSPSLTYVEFAALTFVWPDLAFVSMLAGLFVPVLTLVVLVRLADRFCTERGDPSSRSRALLVAGFAFVNSLLWLGGCSITALNMPGTIHDKRSKPPPRGDTAPREVAPAPAPRP
jgi:hypothetical protein